MNEPHPVFDGDNHYYEALDAFTRHLDPRLGPRVRAVVRDQRPASTTCIGGQVSHAVTNPTFDPMSPGRRHGTTTSAATPSAQPDGVPGRPRADPPRVPRPRRPGSRCIDAQGLDGCWLFPTLGMIYEEPLKHDPYAVSHHVPGVQPVAARGLGLRLRGPHLRRARTSRWPTSTWAVEELEWALDNGARTIVHAPRRADHRRSGGSRPLDPMFDAFWARVNDAGITVVVHAGDGGVVVQRLRRRTASRATFSGGGYKPSIKSFDIERAIYDFLVTLVFDNQFVRFPNLRIASVENGAEFLPDLFRKLRSTAKKMPGFFPDDPIELFKRHVWINPFWEDDVDEVAELHGRRPGDLRLRLAPHRGPARTRSTTSSSSSTSTTPTASGSCSTTSAS